jgi:hypothetical protein
MTATAPHRTGTTPTPPLALLTDEQVWDFICRGYLLLEPPFRSDLNEDVCRQMNASGGAPVNLKDDPFGEALLRQAPALNEVFAHPMVEGAIVSLVGPGYQVYERYPHTLRPGQGGFPHWHQDDVNMRSHQVRRLMVLYYPQGVTPDMGPTVIVPGTHLRNMPTDRMQTYGNFRGQVPLTVKAGTVAVTHYDLWHTASPNRSDKLRYMIKLYIDRKTEPAPGRPTWSHDPANAHGPARHRFHSEFVTGSGTDFYKERHLRWEMWQHLLGNLPPYRPEHRPPRLGEYQGYVGDPRI